MTLVIEVNEDNLNPFEVEESTFIGGEVIDMGRGTNDPCTKKEWLVCISNIVETQSSIDQLHLLL